MRGSFFVDDPDKEASNLAIGDYDEAQKLEGVLEEGQLTIAERVKSL
jgi:hypothetical protein